MTRGRWQQVKHVLKWHSHSCLRAVAAQEIYALDWEAP